MNKHDLVQEAYEVFQVMEDDGTFPNNAKLPVIIYKGAFLLRPDESEAVVIAHFERQNWRNAWTNGVFDYHHYHSNTHEVMGVISGTADLILGGESGVCVEVKRGDVIILPAGVAHKCLKSSDDFSVVGAYPEGENYDMNYGIQGERPKADANIAAVSIPETDPVYGNEGPLCSKWKN